MTRFGKYELSERIAAGGMAEIYKGRFEPAPGVNKPIVIKKILPHYADNKAFIAMFTNEARIAIRLSHGNIAQVFDFGAIDGEYFLAMEFVDGPPLSKVLKRAQAKELRALPASVAVSIASDLLKGLHYAHTRLDDDGRPLGIVHRDVSPQNVLLSYEGQVKIVDFGIARARNAGATETQSDTVKGKYTYFAPEQARGRELDARTDTFAAGVVLYEMVTGQLPFQGKPMEALSKLVRGQFAPPSELNPNLSPALERIILKAMANEPAARFQTAEEFSLELQKYLATYHRDFAATDVPMLVQLLFEEELVREGRPLSIPRAFMEKVRAWQSPTSPGEMESPTDNISVPEREMNARPTAPEPPVKVAPPEAISETLALVPAPNPQPSGPQPLKRDRWVPALIGVVAALAVLALAWAALSKGTLELITQPPGAVVSLDGVVTPQRTPVTISGLDTGRPIRVELLADQHQRWRADVVLKRGQHLLLEQTLEALPPPIEAVHQVAPEPPPVHREARDAVTWPLGADPLVLDAQRHRLVVSNSSAGAITLDPEKKVKVWLSPGPTLGWAFLVVNASGVAPGTFTGTPFLIEGASKLLAFHIPTRVMLDSPARDELKPRRVFTWPEGAKAATVTPVLPMMEFAAERRVTLTGLEAHRQYALSLHDTAASILVGTETGLQVLSSSQPLVLSRTRRAWFTVISDQPALTADQLIIEVKEVAP